MRTVRFFLFFVSMLTLASCHQIKRKAHDAISGAGETVGQGGAEFVEGVSHGVKRSIGTIELSSALRSAGLSFGRYEADSWDSSGNDNQLRIYLIFDKDLEQWPVSVKIFDNKNVEYGRTTLALGGKAGTARNVAIPFDKQTKIEGGSRFVFE